jgi:hypothetical protein
MNWTDQEIEALAQWAMSPDPVNWELFNSQPLEARLQAFDWWWDRWECMGFKRETSHAVTSESVQLAWSVSRYFFLDVKIFLYFGFATRFSVEVKSIDDTIYNSVQKYFHNSTERYPLNLILADIYNAIKKIIINE